MLNDSKITAVYAIMSQQSIKVTCRVYSIGAARKLLKTHELVQRGTLRRETNPDSVAEAFCANSPNPRSRVLPSGDAVIHFSSSFST
jgi:hypothetical protein